MDNGTAERLIHSNNKLISAIGMHWANEERVRRGEALAYNDNDFFNLASEHY